MAIVVPKLLYRHVGELKYIAGDSPDGETGPVLDEIGWFHRLRDGYRGYRRAALKAVKQLFDEKPDVPIALDGLVDHSPLHYAIKIWNEYHRKQPAA